MRTLIVGGTGFVGTALARELHERGHEVTVLSRDPGEAALPPGVDRVAGDVREYDAIEGAFEGQDAVVYLVALSPLFEPRGATHEGVHLVGAGNVVRAAEEHGVGRLVHVSALDAAPDAPTAYLRAKGEAETVVRGSNLDWTIFRPSVVFGEGDEFVGFTRTLTTPYVTALPGGGRTPFQPIWVGDLAPMLADAVEDDRHAGRTYEVGGPEVLTMADVARLAHRAAGRSLAVLPVPMALAAVGGRIAGAFPFVPFGPDQIRSLRVDNTVQDDDVAAFGIDPADLRTLAEYLGVDPEAARAPERTPAAPAVILSVAAFIVGAVALLSAGLATGVWRFDDLARADRLGWGFLVLFVPTAVLLGAGPLFAYLRYRLASPLALLVAYSGYWGVWGPLNGIGVVRALYVGALYAGLFLPVVLVAAVLEYLARSRLDGRGPSTA